MLDIAYMKGCAGHYRHLAAGTENKESAEALLAVAAAFEAEVELLEEQPSTAATSSKKL